MSTPRWKSLLDTALSKYPAQTVIQLSTISNVVSAEPQPKVRSHIIRSILPSEHINYPPPNFPLLISTTDIRTPKASQITANSNVELTWWIDGTKQQFRITAKASLVPSPTREPKGSIRTIVTHHPVAEDSEFWETQRQSTFRGLSGYMKASWCRPVPGTPLALAGGPEGAMKWPERVDEPEPDAPADSEARKNWEEALRNFALVVIEPFEVDFVDLEAQPNRRFRFWRDEEEVWGEDELVP